MTEAQPTARERSLEWIAREFHFAGGVEMAEALRSGTRVEREAALGRMEARACAERVRGLAGHWTYDLPGTRARRIIERERALLATEDLQAARRRYQAAVRQVRHHLHRRGWAPISLLRRLGKARGGFLAAIAGRKEEGDAR